MFRIGKRQLIYQPWRDLAGRADLVIVNEGARFLLNYLLLARQLRGRGRVAFWGHGANLDRTDARSLVERFKPHVYRWPHWWFAYTEGTARRLLNIGYPESRITVVQNTTATEELVRMVEHLPADSEATVRTALSLGEGPIGLFLGSLYPSKRVQLLLEATDTVVRAHPDFRLVVAGEGPQRAELEARARDTRHVVFVGRVDGRRKAALINAADLLLVPGGVGLSINDGFAGGLPLVTTGFPTHGPEIEYLDHGVNGRMLGASASPASYASEIVRLLDNSAELKALQEGAARSARRYTQEAMVTRFSDGIEAALGSG